MPSSSSSSLSSRDINSSGLYSFPSWLKPQRFAQIGVHNVSLAAVNMIVEQAFLSMKWLVIKSHTPQQRGCSSSLFFWLMMMIFFNNWGHSKLVHKTYFGTILAVDGFGSLWASDFKALSQSLHVFSVSLDGNKWKRHINFLLCVSTETCWTETPSPSQTQVRSRTSILTPIVIKFVFRSVCDCSFLKIFLM